MSNISDDYKNACIILFCSYYSQYKRMRNEGWSDNDKVFLNKKYTTLRECLDEWYTIATYYHKPENMKEQAKERYKDAKKRYEQDEKALPEVGDAYCELYLQLRLYPDKPYLHRRITHGYKRGVLITDGSGCFLKKELVPPGSYSMFDDETNETHGRPQWQKDCVEEALQILTPEQRKTVEFVAASSGRGQKTKLADEKGVSKSTITRTYDCAMEKLKGYGELCMMRQRSLQDDGTLLIDSRDPTLIGVLSEEQYSCFIMYYRDKMNIPRIAKEKNLNKATVSRNLKRARDNLHPCIQDDKFEVI